MPFPIQKPTAEKEQLFISTYYVVNLLTATPLSIENIEHAEEEMKRLREAYLRVLSTPVEYTN